MATKHVFFGLFCLFNLTLSEIFLPTTWMFLGLTYNKLDFRIRDGILTITTWKDPTKNHNPSHLLVKYIHVYAPAQ